MKPPTRKPPSKSELVLTRPRPVTFAEFGTDLKPYFTTYQDPERPSSFLDLGLDVEKESSTFNTRVGKYRKWKGLTVMERVFILSSLAFLVSFVLLTTDRLIFFVNKHSQDFTFVLLLLLSSVFCLYYVTHGLFREHGFELFIYAFSVGVVLIYCVANYLETESDSIKLIRFVVVSTFSPPVIAGAIYLGRHYHRSKNIIFRSVGASLYRQNLCVKLYMFVDLLKFDLQLECSVVVLSLEEGANSSLFGGLVVGLGVPISLAWSIIGYLAVRYENRYFLFIFIATGWIQPAYVTYKFIDIYQSWKTFTVASDKLLPSCILVCGLIGLAVHTLLIVLVVYLGVNFGSNIGEKVFGPGDSTREESVAPFSRKIPSSRRRPFSWSHPIKRYSTRWKRGSFTHLPLVPTTEATPLASLRVENLLDRTTKGKFKRLSNLATAAIE